MRVKLLVALWAWACAGQAMTEHNAIDQSVHLMAKIKRGTNETVSSTFDFLPRPFDGLSELCDVSKIDEETIKLICPTWEEVEEIKRHPDVSEFEVDYPIELDLPPSLGEYENEYGDEEEVSTQSYPLRWGQDRAYGDLDGVYLNDTRAGKGAVYYVVDTGVHGSLGEFEGRVEKGQNYASDFSGEYDRLTGGKGGGNVDCNGHGTHVASTAVGKSWGIAKGAIVVPIRVLDCNGRGYMSSIVQGLQFAKEDYIARGKPPAVVGMSIGGPFSSVTNAKVKEVTNAGLAVVVAAGNSRIPACRMSPAAAREAVTVCATDFDDGISWFSNYGECVDICAPGRNIDAAYVNPPIYYKRLTGTSMAQPIQAASVLIHRAKNPKQNAYEAIDDVLGLAREGVLEVPTGTPNLFVNVDVSKGLRRCQVNRKFGLCKKYDHCKWYGKTRCYGSQKCRRIKRWKKCAKNNNCRWIKRGCRPIV